MFLGLWHLQYDTPSVFVIYAVIRGFGTPQEETRGDSPAKVLLRHRLGRRVAAEARPATMLLRYRSGARLVGVCVHTLSLRREYLAVVWRRIRGLVPDAWLYALYVVIFYFLF